MLLFCHSSFKEKKRIHSCLLALLYLNIFLCICDLWIHVCTSKLMFSWQCLHDKNHLCNDNLKPFFYFQLPAPPHYSSVRVANVFNSRTGISCISGSTIIVTDVNLHYYLLLSFLLVFLGYL